MKTGATNLSELIKHMTPVLHDGDYVFTSLINLDLINREDVICEFKEKEGTTVVIERHKADTLGLDYNYVCAWITLTVHSSLEAVGLTAAFSTELAQHNISCNVIAGFYHDHIFVDKAKAERAVGVLMDFSKYYK